MSAGREERIDEVGKADPSIVDLDVDVEENDA